MAGSLASATSSRVDSASKHIVPCKVNTDYMVSLMELSTSDGTRELQVNKMKYCMHKDDIVIGLGRPCYGTSTNMCNKKAYPSVVTNMGGSSKHFRRFIALKNFAVSKYDDMNEIKNAICGNHDHSPENNASGLGLVKNDLIKFRKQVENSLEMYFVGVSLGLAYAHSHSGDTVASVMVGGLKTVLNGAFKVGSFASHSV